MLGPYAPLEAYRLDLVRATGRERFGAADESWVLAAHVLRGIAELPAEARRAHAERLTGAVAEAQRADASQPDRPPAERDTGSEWVEPAVIIAELAGDPERLVEHVTALATEIELGGALLLAYTVLAALRDLLPGEARLPRGTVLVHQARVARQLGELDAASDLYEQAGRIGAELGQAELRVRAELGLAVVARMRGNYPTARTLFRRALARAARSGLDRWISVAHEGLLITAGVAGDLNGALRHGWAAFEHAGEDSMRQAELLANLSAACSEAGFDRAALHGYLAAAARTTHPHVRLPVLSGAAVSAARLGDMRELERITRTLEDELAGDTLPFEKAQALVNLAEAWSTAAREGAAARCLDRAEALARRRGFHELLHQAEGVRSSLRRLAQRRLEQHRLEQRQSVVLTSTSRGVLRSLEALGAGEVARK